MSTTKSTAERISALLVKDYKLNPLHLTPDARLTDLGIDSLGMAELMFNIEDEFGVELDSDPAQITTFGEVVHFIDAVIAEQSVAKTVSAQVPYPTAQSPLNTVIGAPLAP